MLLLLVRALAGFAVAGTLPENFGCPVDALVRETEARNLKNGQDLGPGFYNGLAVNYRRQCVRARAEIDRLESKIASLSEEQRNGRDGYVLLERMWHQFEVLRATETPEADAVQKRLQVFLKTHPEYFRLQKVEGSFLTSEESNKREREEDRRQAIIARAKAFVPKDDRPMDFIGQGKELAVAYQAKLSFYRLPDDIEFSITDNRQLLLTRKDGGEVKLESFTPVKTVTYKRRFEVLPRGPRSKLSHFMICTFAFPELGENYAVFSSEDRELARQASQYFPRHVNQDGAEDFCGIMRPSGEIVYEFPIKQSDPGTLIWPIGMREGHAVIAVGEKTSFETADEPVSRPGNFRELLVWDAPNKLTRTKIDPKERGSNKLHQRFLEGKL